MLQLSQESVRAPTTLIDLNSSRLDGVDVGSNGARIRAR
jgi:hypothetical protein